MPVSTASRMVATASWRRRFPQLTETAATQCHCANRPHRASFASNRPRRIKGRNMNPSKDADVLAEGDHCSQIASVANRGNVSIGAGLGRLQDACGILSWLGTNKSFSLSHHAPLLVQRCRPDCARRSHLSTKRYPRDARGQAQSRRLVH
jgi:hypothetical protein